MKKKKDFTYTIKKQYGTISTAGSLPIELNLISFRGAAPRYDIRKWRTKEDGERSMQKGITLTREELRDLRSFLIEVEELV